MTQQAKHCHKSLGDLSLIPGTHKTTGMGRSEHQESSSTSMPGLRSWAPALKYTYQICKSQGDRKIEKAHQLPTGESVNYIERGQKRRRTPSPGQAELLQQNTVRVNTGALVPGPEEHRLPFTSTDGRRQWALGSSLPGGTH